MDFSLSMEQKILRESVRAFAEKEIKPVAQTLDETETFSYELTKAMGELGLFGVFVSEQYGGQELDYLSYIIAVEELARVDASQAATVAAANSLDLLFWHRRTKKEISSGALYGKDALGLWPDRAGRRL